MAPQVISHWVDNEVFTGSSGGTAPVTNPATGEVSGQVALASVEDARTVIDAAAAAFPDWRDTSLAKRTAVLFRFRELLNERKDELAAIITAEDVIANAGALISVFIRNPEFQGQTKAVGDGVHRLLGGLDTHKGRPGYHWVDPPLEIDKPRAWETSIGNSGRTRCGFGLQDPTEQGGLESETLFRPLGNEQSELVYLIVPGAPLSQLPGACF